MHIKYIQDEDFTNYKECSMFIGTPLCTFKCEKECGIFCCQNSALVKAPTLEIRDEDLLERYLRNPFTKAIVIGGLEPMDSFDEVLSFCRLVRTKTLDPIVIYTGYYPEEIENKIISFSALGNIIIKFGRFIPNMTARYDEILGITLASPNQFAKQIG